MGEPEKDAVRRFYSAWSRGDLDGMLAEADAAFEAHPTLGVLYERSSYHGHDGIRAWFGEVAERWQAFDPAVLELIERDGRVIAFIHLTATRRDQPFDARIAVIHELRDGRIVSLVGRDLWEVAEELGG